MALVIADTSPLQYLFQLDLLDLLSKLYGTVLVPEAVRDELLVGRSLGLRVPDPADFSWITLCPTITHAVVEPFDLGAGEQAVLSLAFDRVNAIVVLDDSAARTAAAVLNVPATGTLGVMLLAKERGLVTSVTAALKELERLGFRIAPALLARVLAMAGE